MWPLAPRIATSILTYEATAREMSKHAPTTDLMYACSLWHRPSAGRVFTQAWLKSMHEQCVDCSWWL